MKSGYRPRKFLWMHVKDHRDHDFLKTHLMGSVGVPELPPEIRNDRKLWMPNQNEPEPIFGNPAMPDGCTDYAQNDLASNFANELFNPAYTESKTHANANGGGDMRVSFSSVINDGVQNKAGIIKKPFKQYFIVVAQATLDWFDAFRTSLFLGQADFREISVGMPWFSEYESTGPDGQLPTPANWKSPMSWHDAVVCGYVLKNQEGLVFSEPKLEIKSWQGTKYADEGYCYMSRAQANMTFSMSGTIALIGSPVAVPGVQYVDLSWVQYVLSFARMVANRYLMRPAGNLWQVLGI